MSLILTRLDDYRYKRTSFKLNFFCGRYVAQCISSTSMKYDHANLYDELYDKSPT